MSTMRWGLATRLLIRDWRAGETIILVVALVVAVMASCFYLLTRRIAFSGYLSLTIMMITTLMSVVSEYGDDRSTALQDAAWSVLTSTEFTFNH